MRSRRSLCTVSISESEKDENETQVISIDEIKFTSNAKNSDNTCIIKIPEAEYPKIPNFSRNTISSISISSSFSPEIEVNDNKIIISSSHSSSFQNFEEEKKLSSSSEINSSEEDPSSKSSIKIQSPEISSSRFQHPGDKCSNRSSLNSSSSKSNAISNRASSFHLNVHDCIPRKINPLDPPVVREHHHEFEPFEKEIVKISRNAGILIWMKTLTSVVLMRIYPPIISILLFEIIGCFGSRKLNKISLIIYLVYLVLGAIIKLIFIILISFLIYDDQKKIVFSFLIFFEATDILFGYICIRLLLKINKLTQKEKSTLLDKMGREKMKFFDYICCYVI
ncbi:hypothetical protein SteCoe_13969 [Stentor coeruleus]|uniref:Uncharacterized protein n=1 Tax=Stentor coeruleus TaxID=5963 RepID=A0A1R2C748_9CILI|nr:hypothetical protein SteCoe_13969 [Stentor coeruleus]